ncbi:MAG: hypothetical protein JNG88_13290, partial [Phycisphaerales bacterium]|nr:hypothetical protein [Phycisphaerales bacterium]
MNHIALIGMRGSGKTSVGRVVAANLGRAFVDCDEHIEQRAGISIRELFEQHGESGFRRLESEILAGLLGASNQVVSVGGGAVIAAENRRLLATRAICVWLRAS